MARIKAEVREHAHQQRLARQHHHASSPTTPTSVPSPSPALEQAPDVVKLEDETPQPRELSVTSSVAGGRAGCIDLTADEKTEDEEEADEPFAAAMQRVREEQEQEQQGEQKEEEQEQKGDQDRDHDEGSPMELETDVEEEERPPVMMSASTASAQGRGEREQVQEEGSPMELETDVEEEEAPPTIPRVSAADGDVTDESDVDEAMPASQVGQGYGEEEDGATEAESASLGVSRGVRAVVDTISHALSAVMPSFARGGTAAATSAAVEEEVKTAEPQDTSGGDVEEEEGDKDEEEEDERWPEVHRQETEIGKFSDIDSTGSETGDDSVASPSPDASTVAVGESLEDGEIFEEGAVAKSPTAVKEAIAQELHAARAAVASSSKKKQKKQKKRGRKKNKRKAEAMLAAALENEETIDEFGRNVRHHAMPWSEAMSMELSAHAQEFVPQASVSMQPPVSAPLLLPLPPLMATPRRPVSAPPLPPPLPMDEYGHPPGQHPFVDDQIVRVHRHGGFEPFALYANRGPRPPIAPPFTQRPPPQTGFRYLPVERFGFGTNDAVGSPSRGRKRSRPSKFSDVPPEMFDLDSLRAAALKTKRKTAAEDATVALTGTADTSVVDVTASDPSVASAVSSNGQEDEHDLDDLRWQLLKSIQRKRQEQPSSQAIMSAPEAIDDTSARKSLEGKSPPKAQAESEAGNPIVAEKVRPPVETPKQLLTVKNCSSLTAPPVLESPQLRPLTALSQSVVIRLSLADLSMEQSKSRANSEDDITTRFAKSVGHGRAKTTPAKTPPTTNGASAVRPVEKKPVEPQVQSPPISKTATPTEEQPSCVAVDFENSASSIETENSTSLTAERREASTAPPAEPTKVSPVQEPTRATPANPVDKEKVVMNSSTKVVDTEVLADPAKLEAERVACLENIREADANIARLDAAIAALRLALATREANAPSNGSSSAATTCGA